MEFHLVPTSKQVAVSVYTYLLLYVQSQTPDDGQKDHLKHVQCYSKINKFWKLVHLVGFTIEISSLFTHSISKLVNYFIIPQPVQMETQTNCADLMC
jgi:hypothetical protein